MFLLESALVDSALPLPTLRRPRTGRVTEFSIPQDDIWDLRFKRSQPSWAASRIAGGERDSGDRKKKQLAGFRDRQE